MAHDLTYIGQKYWYNLAYIRYQIQKIVVHYRHAIMNDPCRCKSFLISSSHGTINHSKHGSYVTTFPISLVDHRHWRLLPRYWVVVVSASSSFHTTRRSATTINRNIMAEERASQGTQHIVRQASQLIQLTPPWQSILTTTTTTALLLLFLHLHCWTVY